MQRTIADNAHRVHYSAVDTAQLPHNVRGPLHDGADAVDVLLEAAFARSQQPGRIVTGVAEQQTEGLHMDAAEAALVARAPPTSRQNTMTSPNATTAIGYCGHAGGLPGSCESDTVGRVPLRNASEMAKIPGLLTYLRFNEKEMHFDWPSSVHSPATIDDCADFCGRCSQCNFISYSLLHGHCEWYKTCDMSEETLLSPAHKLFGGRSYITVAVKESRG